MYIYIYTYTYIYIYVYIYIHLCVYIIIKTIYPPGYHHNGFVETHALGHMMYGWEYIYILHSSCFCEI